MTAAVSSALLLDIALQQAAAHHQAGQLQEAEELYRAILQIRPDHPDVNHNLGVLLGQTEQAATGLLHLKAALEADPAQGRYWLSYAEALLASGQAGEALTVIQTAIQCGLDTPAAQSLRQKAEDAAQDGLATDASETSDQIVQQQTNLPQTSSGGTFLAELLRAGKTVAKNGKSAKKGKSSETLPQAECNQLVALFNAGRYMELESRARSDCGRYPDSGVVWVLLGASLQMQGKDGLPALQKATKLLPDDAAAHNNLGNALREHGKLDGAVASCRRALEIKPNYAEAHNNLGCVLRELGQYDGAVASCRRALEIKPDYAEAYNNLGVVLRELGQYDGAVASYRRALEIKPNFTGALNNLASLLNDQGMSKMALDLAGQSLRFEETWEVKSIYVSTLKGMHFNHVDRDVWTNLVRALSEPWCRPNELGGIVADFVKLNSNIGSAVAKAVLSWPRLLSAQALFEPAGFAAVASDPLLRALLGSMPICDIDLERFLTMARRAMLDAASGVAFPDGDDGVSLEFFGALARQCFINEYVFSLAADEADQARKLRDSLVAALETEAPIPAVWPVAVAAYFPLHSLSNAARLLDQPWPDAVDAVLVQQVREPEEERQYRATLPRLTPIEDAVSLLVQGQYEENPYPRWVMASPAGKSTTIDVSLRRRFPLSHFQPLGIVRAPDILIAGCGTGQHPIETAQQFRGARVLAIDLSLTSLCYAKRKTQELGLTSIEYAQADILKLGSIERRFDIIESSGVLHHLDDPWAGWRVLLSLLRPGGFMHLGFYSEVARRDIVRARAFIAEQGYGSTVEEIRQCRQDLMNLDESAGFSALLKSGDMFSISGCRDLLFHVQEHRMTLTGIEAFLRENGLQFLGFDINSRLLHAYRLRFPDDRAATNLNQWQVFENENPDTFSAMYQFWVQKLQSVAGNSFSPNIP